MCCDVLRTTYFWLPFGSQYIAELPLQQIFSHWDSHRTWFVLSFWNFPAAHWSQGILPNSLFP